MVANAGMSVTCERCGESFHVPPERLRRKNKPRFCSWTCRVTTNDPAYFWARVDIRGPDECWPWKQSDGDYGFCAFEGKPRAVHKVAFRLTHGYWPPYLRHSCDNPPCCNPAHLLEGTHRDNMDDMVERRRRARGEASPQAKLTEADVRAIRVDSRSTREIAKAYSLTSSSHVSRIRSRKNWKHVE